MNYHSIKKTILSLLVLVFTTSVVIAQSDQAPQVQQERVKIEIEDDELEKYVEALTDLQEVQAEMQGEIMEIVADEGLDAETFNNIQRAKAMQQSNPEVKVDFPEEDIQKFDKAAVKVVELQTEANKEMQEIVMESGIDLERFQQISIAMQSDPELQVRFRDMMSKELDD